MQAVVVLLEHPSQPPVGMQARRIRLQAGARLDGEISEADCGEGVEGEVECVEISPVVVVQPEGDRVAGLVVEAGVKNKILRLGRASCNMVRVRVVRVRVRDRNRAAPT